MLVFRYGKGAKADDSEYAEPNDTVDLYVDGDGDGADPLYAEAPSDDGDDSYLETDRYPECIFRGKISGDTAEGEITLHGQTKKLSVPITFNQSNDRIEIKTEFNIVLDDFKIKVPRLLFQNIAEDIDVKVESTFSKYMVQ